MTNSADEQDLQAVHPIRRRYWVAGITGVVAILIRLFAMSQQWAEQEQSFEATNQRMAVEIAVTHQALMDELLGTPPGETTADASLNSLQAYYDARLAEANAALTRTPPAP